MLGPQGIGWLTMHVFGIAVLFVAMKDAAFSMVFYAVAGSGRLQRADESSRLVRLAARYALPFRMLLSVALHDGRVWACQRNCVPSGYFGYADLDWPVRAGDHEWTARRLKSLKRELLSRREVH